MKLRKKIVAILVTAFLSPVSYAYDTETLVDTNNNSTSTSTVTSTSTNTNNNNNVNDTTVNSTSTNTNTTTSTNTNTNVNQNINSGTQTFNNNNVNTTTSNNTNTNINTSTSTSTSTSENTNNNNNVNTSTSTNTNTNNNVNQNINSGTMTNNNNNVNTTDQKIQSPPPTAVAPAMMSGGNNDLCTVGSSGAVQTQILGVSSGSVIRDKNCERLKNAKVLYDMGMKVAAVSTLCQDRRIFDAMWNAGTPCPYEGTIGAQAKIAWEQNPDKIPPYEEEESDPFYKKTMFGAMLGYLLFIL